MIVNSFTEKESRIRYVHESEVGLSIARNRGSKEALGPWLVFIDDDAILPTSYFQTLKSILGKHPNIVCLGGPYFAHYEEEKPKWVSKDFGNKKWAAIKDQQLTEGNLSGSNFIIRKELLESIGGFPIHLGMSGKRISYGEEDFVQEKIKLLGHKILFFPQLFLYHTVLPHKLNLSWHLKHAFASGRDQARPKNMIRSAGNLLKQICISVFFRLPIGLIRVLFTTQYYYQNLILDVASPVLFHLGVFWSRKPIKSN